MDDMNERNIKQVDILIKAEPFCKKYNVKLNKNDLSQYVNGKVEPGQQKLSILGMALNVNEAWLMGYDDVSMDRNSDGYEHNNSSADPDIRRIERARKLMPPEKWNSMMKTVEAAFSEYFDDNYVDDDLDE